MCGGGENLRRRKELPVLQCWDRAHGLNFYLSSPHSSANGSLPFQGPGTRIAARRSDWRIHAEMRPENAALVSLRGQTEPFPTRRGARSGHEQRNLKWPSIALTVVHGSPG